MLRRYADSVKLIDSFNNYRTASYQRGGKFDILSNPKKLNKVLGEAQEKFNLVGKAKEDFYYVIARSLTSTRNDLGQRPVPNGNGDCFIHTELCRTNKELQVPAYHTFIGKGVYIDHRSDEVEACFGTQLDVRIAYQKPPVGVADTCIHNLLAIDKEKAEQLGILSGIKNDVLNTWSMGCDVQGVQCSICGNIVSDPDQEACEHAREYKTQEMVCEADNLPWKGQKVRTAELLLGVDFIELSAVTVPADYRAETQEVIGDINSYQQKQANYPTEIPVHHNINNERNTSRMCDVVKNERGGYTVIIEEKTEAEFDDYQVAMDYIDEQRHKRESRMVVRNFCKTGESSKNIFNQPVYNENDDIDEEDVVESNYDDPGNFEYDTEPGYNKNERKKNRKLKIFDSYNTNSNGSSLLEVAKLRNKW